MHFRKKESDKMYRGHEMQDVDDGFNDYDDEEEYDDEYGSQS